MRVYKMSLLFSFLLQCQNNDEYIYFVANVKFHAVLGLDVEIVPDSENLTRLLEFITMIIVRTNQKIFRYLSDSFASCWIPQKKPQLIAGKYFIIQIQL